MTTGRQAARQAAIERDEAARDRKAAAGDRRRAAAMLASACLDELTGTFTRRAGHERLRVEIVRARRTESELCVVFIDVDGLKTVNDEHGHMAGDEILAAVGIALRESLRAYDVVIRYGGDEFVCVMPGVSQETAARAIARARSRAAGLAGRARFSVGYASLRDHDQIEDVVRRADEDLYARRRSARANATHASSNGNGVPAAPERYPTQVVAPSLACGQCGEQIPLGDFTQPTDETATRSANCATCGETTVIHIVHPRPGAYRNGAEARSSTGISVR